MYVYIKTLENKYILDVNPEHTIIHLKYQIQDILEIKYEQQRLIYKGQSLADENTIKNSGIRENEIIHMLLNMI